MAKAGYVGNQPVRESQAESYPGAWTGQEQYQEIKSDNWPKSVYEIERSIRLNSADSAFFSRTPASAGNRKTWTWAGWVKGVVTSENPHLFTCTTGATDATYFRLWFVSDSIRVSNYNNTLRQTSAVYRDPSAWYHIVLAVDTTQATAANRIKLYVNGSEVTAFSSSVNPNQNDDLGINQAAAHSIGATSAGGGTLSAYLANIHFIDGLALTPDAFGTTDPDTNQWVPKKYTNSYGYGTNGFWLKFSDNSAATATTLGKDYSGNSNNWTPNNLSVTAGAGNDSLVDTPTSYGTDDGLGGSVRGNYCTWNPLRDNRSGYNEAPRNGNLDTNPRGDFVGTLSLKSGKYYWEILIQAVTTSGQAYIGAVDYNQVSESGSRGWSTSQIAAMRDTGGFYGNGSTGTAVSYGQGDVLGFALDVDAGKLWIAKNGTWVNSGNPAAGTGHAFSGLAFNSYTPIASDSNTGQVYVLNAGQRAWSYTAPSGFKALCDTNLPAPVVAKPSTVMDVVLYTGNGSTQTISGLGFSPDLVWGKGRNAPTGNVLYDTVRGATKMLTSNSQIAEATIQGVTAFNFDGFTLGSNSDTNLNSGSFVAWCWDAGSSTVTNTQGSITSQVRASASSGFSVLTYTGNNSTGTVGHGLGVAPQFIIYKTRSGVLSWQVYHASLGATKHLVLHTTDAVVTSIARWNNTEPSNTVVSLGTHGANSYDYVMYCWAPVAGYSSFGSYTGNNSADGPFQWCGFRPRWLLIKSAGYAADWIIVDAARETYNVMQKALFPNQSYYEAQASTALRVDFLSNGFKIRSTDGNAEGWNYPSNAHVWAAFAENPFQYARAR